MSVVESPSFAAAIDCLRRRFERSTGFPSPSIVPSKRKLDEFSPAVCPGDDMLSIRMRKLETSDIYGTSGFFYDGARNEDDDRVSTSCCSTNDVSGGPRKVANSGSVCLQFFVRVASRTMVIRALPEDTVELVHDRIREITGIPTSEQRLIFMGRQLSLDSTLAQCGVEKDSCLQLTGRLRSTGRPESWMVANDIVSAVSGLKNNVKQRDCIQKSVPKACGYIENLVKIFLEMIPKDDSERAVSHLNVFLFSGAPSALVMLYATSRAGSFGGIQAENSIRYFLGVDSELMPSYIHAQCFPIVLEFSKRLATWVGKKDKLYTSCRKTLSSLLESTAAMDHFQKIDCRRPQSFVQEIFPFIKELSSSLSATLSKWLESGFNPGNLSLVSGQLGEFSSFLFPLQDRLTKLGPFPIPLYEESSPPKEDWFLSLHAIFMELLEMVDQCLKEVHNILNSPREERWGESKWTELAILLPLLTRLKELSKIFQGADEILHSFLVECRVPLNALIRRAKCRHSLWWLLEHRDVVDFESRRALAMSMFPDEKDDFDDLFEMLIDRSYILTDSFAYITHADPLSLQSGLFMEFKNEEATGPGVLREWFCLLCQEIFTEKNVLFLSCPNDRRRFFPNPASAVDPLHLEYFTFCGRVIALALMHNVQVGVVFDRIFFLQLAGKNISLDDVHDADPFLFSSCKKILEMDAELLDSDVLGLTFIREFEHLGSRKTVQLCPGGKDILVNSRNRQCYVDLMIQHCFVTSISEQVNHFLEGFRDILLDSNSHKLFFGGLDLDDFDRMLGGSDATICTKDWKKNTEYKGYKASDRQIFWFWKVVGCMSTDERRALLFFWTSVKFLPSEGFSGLDAKLYIYRSSSSIDHLPTSHTCFYRLCLPAYPSLATMKKQLFFLTQDHVGCSFGTP